MLTPPDRDKDALSLSASVVVSLAVCATLGLAGVVHVLSAAGGGIGGRLLAVLPIYFVAVFAVAQLAFWLLRFVVGAFISLDMRGHAVLTGLTFLLAGVLHYAESTGVQRVLSERAASGGSCPSGMACTALRPADEIRQGDVASRRAAAERARLAADGFALLVRDPDPAVRAALARRPDLPPELLERLAGDRHPVVREVAAGSLRLSDEALTRLAFDREERVRLAVARNRNAPPTALEVLAANVSADVRLLVAEHPRSSESILQRLLNDRADRAEQIARERLRGGRTP